MKAFSPNRLLLVALVLGVALPTLAPAAEDMPPDLLERDLEYLTTRRLSTVPRSVSVTTASKFSQTLGTAPASVHIITADDIQTYGYRTLGEALRMLPGVYLSNDRNYSYLGVRGFSRPADFNSRVLLLVDGERINDNLYDSAVFGNDVPVDIDLIDRIEFVPGSGSAVYGSNAFLGVVNVITKHGHSLNGTELSGSYGSFDAFKVRGSYGKRFDNGAELLLSGTGFDWEGADRLYYREFDTPQQHRGRAVGLDYDRGQTALAKFSYHAFSLQAGFADRIKGIPTASFGQVFNDPSAKTDDRRVFVTAKYNDKIGRDWDVYARLGYNQYDYRGTYPYRDTTHAINIDQGTGAWWGGELRFTNTGFDRHRLMLGLELQDNVRQLQRNFDRGGPVYLDRPYRSLRYGFFLQDEFRLLDSLTLMAGARYDHTPFGESANPRIGLTWRALDSTTLKFLYGTAFRAPNVFELFYSDGGITAKANPGLRPENIESIEFDLEHYLTPSTRLAAAFYRYKLNRLIGQVNDPSDDLLYYRNLSGADGMGMELEAEHRFADGIRAILGYSLQRAQDSRGAALLNSPEHMLKLHLSAPLASDEYRLGWETLYFDQRRSKQGKVDGYLLSNLNLVATPLPNLSVSLGLYNLWNVRYRDPVGDDFLQDRILQDGRGFRLRLTVRF